MLDQDTARALLTIADESRARIAFVGDRHQLPAVGRGGVLDLATRWAHPRQRLVLDAVHRFADPDYADLSLLMRTGERSGEVFDALVSRGQIVVHPSEVERTAALTTVDGLVIADTRELVSAASTQPSATTASPPASRPRPAPSPPRSPPQPASGSGSATGSPPAATTANLGVANRDCWTVTGLGAGGILHVTGRAGERSTAP